MKIKPIIVALFLSAFLFLPIVQAGEVKPGSYVLELNIEDMAPGDKHTEWVGEVKTNGDDFTFHTNKANGDVVVISGQVTEKGVVMWAVSVERGHLRALHYTGKIVADLEGIAEGKVSLMQDHKRVTGGTWKLRPSIASKVPEDEAVEKSKAE